MEKTGRGLSPTSEIKMMRMVMERESQSKVSSCNVLFFILNDLASVPTSLLTVFRYYKNQNIRIRPTLLNQIGS